MARNGNISSATFYNDNPPQLPNEKKYRYDYSYDPRKQLLSGDYRYYSGSWQNADRFDVTGLQYDGNGNILALVRKKENDASIDDLTYQYGSNNQLQSVADAVAVTPEDWDAEDSEFEYDANGNVIAILENGQPAISNIQYDHRNLPTSFINRNGNLAVYRYDASGQRIYKKVGSQEGEHYIMDGSQNVAVFDESGSLKYWNILANGVSGKRTATGEKRYYLKDHLGSTRAVVNSAGTVVEAHDYYPFGLLMPGRSYLPGERTKELFTGKERDSETGLDYFGARYYWPAGGRWLAVDPLAEKYPSLSPYSYAANNPVNNLERDGRFFDILADVGFIAYDIYDIASTAISGGEVSGTQWAALGADIAGALIPGATGGGAAVRAAGKADEVVDLVKGTEMIGAAASSSKKVKEGVYEVVTTEGKTYVGQSKNIDRRLKEHVSSGKISEEAAEQAKRTEVKGGKEAREVAEHKKLQKVVKEAGGPGLENVANERWPIGEKRKHLLEEK